MSGMADEGREVGMAWSSSLLSRCESGGPCHLGSRCSLFKMLLQRLGQEEQAGFGGISVGSPGGQSRTKQREIFVVRGEVAVPGIQSLLLSWLVRDRDGTNVSVSASSRGCLGSGLRRYSLLPSLLRWITAGLSAG